MVFVLIVKRTVVPALMVNNVMLVLNHLFKWLMIAKNHVQMDTLLMNKTFAYNVTKHALPALELISLNVEDARKDGYYQDKNANQDVLKENI